MPRQVANISFNCGSQCSSCIISGLKVCSPACPAFWQRCFHLTWLCGSQLYLAISNILRESLRHREHHHLCKKSSTCRICQAVLKLPHCRPVPTSTNQGVYHLAFEHHSQSEVIALDTFQVSFDSFIGAHWSTKDNNQKARQVLAAFPQSLRIEHYRTE